MNSKVTFRPFQTSDDRDAKAFKNISIEWISKYWTLEEKDIHSLEHPKENILDKGGKIYMIDLDNEPVGCCALLPIENNGFEVAKMGLLERSRGLGIGKKLLQDVIQEARSMGATWLYLESNSVLTPALKLYESVGFHHIPEEKRKKSPYQRCNVYMDMYL
jgi:GNAT superfamily N-acetyltransferase